MGPRDVARPPPGLGAVTWLGCDVAGGPAKGSKLLLLKVSVATRVGCDFVISGAPAT